MRHYRKGSQLRRAGLSDWRDSLLQMIITDRKAMSALAVLHDPTLRTEQDRIARFTAMCGASRATYFRIKAKFEMR